MGTYVPPAVGTSGLTIPAFQAILSWINSNYSSVFGSTVYLGPDSSDEQFNAIIALQVSDLCQALQAVWLSFNLLTAIGTSLDLLGKLVGVARKQASYSTVILAVSGASGTVIVNGLVQDSVGNYWNLPASVTIPSGGSVNVTATAQKLGNITANPATITIISSPTAGWTGVTNPGAAVPGNAVEPDSQYRARLLISQAIPSLSLVAGSAAAIAAVANVTRSQVYENQYAYTTSYGLVNTSGTAVTLVNGYPFDSTMATQAIVISGVSYTITTPITSNSLTLTGSAGSQTGASFSIGGGIALGPGHSITSVVEGGTSTAIATAIYNNKNPGCLTNGTTTVSVTDPNNGGITIPISFDVLGYVDIYVSISIHALTGFTSATQTAIAAGVVSYLNSLGIGQSVIYSELYGAALSAQVSATQPSFSIRSLTSASEIVQTTGTTTLGSPTVTVTSATSIVNGQTIVGIGIPANTTITISGTTVTLSNNATANGSGVTLSFFLPSNVDIPVPYSSASLGLAENVVVVTV